MFRNTRFWILGVLIIGLLSWGACGGEDTASDEPIRIGLLHPHTGALAGLGVDMTSGYEHYFEEEGMVIAGRQIEIIVEDSEGNPSVGLDKLKKLIERETSI